MPVRRTSGTLLAAAGLVWGSVVLSAPALSQDKGSLETRLSTLEKDASEATQQTISRDGFRSSKTAEQRLADGRILVSLKSYGPASIVLTDVVENHPQHAGLSEARFLLGEALFGSGEYYGARTQFRALIASGDPNARPYTSRALGRLIEIAIRTRNFDGVDQYFEQLNQLPSQEVEAAARYYRAKFTFNKAIEPVDLSKREGALDAKVADQAALNDARSGFEAVGESSPYYGPARYFVGVILALQGQYPQAIQAFDRVVKMPVSTPEQQEMHELATLALGRLYYETDQLPLAVSTYESVPQSSRWFDAALYEVAWVHIRAKNPASAERALATLVESTPDSSYVAEGIVLRGNLLMRVGDLDEATDVFQGASQGYSPVRDNLNAVVAGRDDANAYFKGLVREHFDDYSVGAVLPQSAVPFARDELEFEHATRVMGELHAVRAMVSESETIIRRFNDALAAENRANIYPDSRRLRLRNTAILNRATQLRSRMVRQVEEKSPSVGGEAAAARKERKSMEKAVAALPVSEDQFAARDKEPLARFKTLGRQLRGIETEVYALEARIAAAERYLRESAALRADPAGIAAVEAELKGHRRAVELYRASLVDAAHVIDAGRLRVGVDDERYQADKALRARYREAATRELAAVGSAASSVNSLHQRVGSLEASIDAHDQRIDGVLAERDTEIRRLLAVEAATLDGHKQQLAGLETEAEDVVGGATLAGYTHVRQRVYDLVLRADVGGVDVRWAEREKHRLNVEKMTRDRARELEALDNEYNEIMGQSKGDAQ